jgi:hypothetical protein
MNIDLSVLVKKYLVASLIAIFGIVMIIVGFQTNQDSIYTVAAFNIFIGGVLSVLFSAGVLSRNIVLGIGAVCVAVTVYVIALGYNSLQGTIDHIEQRKVSERLVRFNLLQVRDIQRAHRGQHGDYAKDWKELKDFYENGKIEVIESQGTVPSRAITLKERDSLYGDKRAIDNLMTEREAALLAAMGNPDNKEDLIGFKRDTVTKSFKKDFESNVSRLREMKSLGIASFNIDDLKYIPMTDPKEEWNLSTGEVVVGTDTLPSLRVEGLEPIPRFEDGERKIVGFGDLQSNSDKASWE